MHARGSGAARCSSLRAVVLPASTRTIGDGAFLGCASLPGDSDGSRVPTIVLDEMVLDCLQKMVLQKIVSLDLHISNHLMPPHPVEYDRSR